MRGKKQLFSYLLFLGFLLGTPSLNAGDGDQPPRTKAHGILANYFEAPISFEPNQGQADLPVKFVARGAGYNLFLTPNNAVFSFRNAGQDKGPTPREKQVITMSVMGANPATKISGEDELPAKSSYFSGTDPKSWHTNIPNFGKVQYQNIYPGIDLVFHGTQGQLEYDFVVRPGATPKVIAIVFTGAKRIKLSPQGELVLQAGRGQVFFHKPVAYQGEGERKQSVPSHYRIIGKNQVGFVVGSYDSNQPLIIDPVLTAPPSRWLHHAEAASAAPQAATPLEIR